LQSRLNLMNHLNLKKMKREQVKKVSIFDFDGTLINTALPDEGRKIWKDKTGEDYPHRGWWSKKETLDVNVFENEPFDDMVDAFEIEKSNANTFLVLCTGRIVRLTNEVNAILDKYGFVFDDVILNGDRRYSGKGMDNDTMAFKLRVLGDMIKQFPNLEELEFWDDRDEHMVTFRQWARQQKIKVTINHVHQQKNRH